jgi:hypothetical protein
MEPASTRNIFTAERPLDVHMKTLRLDGEMTAGDASRQQSL